MKKRQKYEVLGLMSGTSLDGLDLASCSFDFTEEGIRWKINAAETISYPQDLQDLLARCTTLNGEELSLLDVRLGHWFGEMVSDFITRNECRPDLISSHGHTVFHQPEHRLTLQIGSGYELHAMTGLPVVFDFRRMDVALGGQGAPLVPVGDRLLFPEYDACLNLGGIANISYKQDDQRLAYDISFCNMVLNYLARRKGQEFDHNGELALRGKPDKFLLDQLESLSYYSLPFPKSLGFEYIEKEVFPLLETDDRVEDYLVTCVHHTATCIGEAVKRINYPCRILATGGGAFNPVLMQFIRKELPDGSSLEAPSPLVVGFKEALVFALLGVLRWRNEVNILASVTGASKNTSSGVMIGSEQL